MRLIQLAAFIILSAGSLWAMEPGAVRAADLANDAVYGIKLGMSVSAAERVLTEKTSGLSEESLAPGALRIERSFYDCASLKTVFVMRASTKTAIGYRAFGPQLTPPAGTCTDIDTVKLPDGQVTVTYLPTRPGDASSQVVARVELAEDILFSHALPSESIPVHYYERIAIEKYGEPTYRDAFRPHKTMKPVPYLKFPDGQALYSEDAIGGPAYCNQTKCHEHQGYLAWCPDGVTASACSRPSGLPEDAILAVHGKEDDKYLEFQNRLLHYETPFLPRPIIDFGISRGTPSYRQDIARQEAENRDGEKQAHDSWLKVQYQLDPVADGPEMRLVEVFLKDGPQLHGRPQVLIILDDLALFRKTFPTKRTVPAPVLTPSF